MTSEKLPFTHGIEMENYLVDKTGHILTGERLLSTWNKMFDQAAVYMKQLVKSSGTPKSIAKKIKKIYVKEVTKREKKLKFVFVDYSLGKKVVTVNAFGPDPNISQITWLCEIVTPPCDSLDELEWWLRELLNAARPGLKEDGAYLMTIGINPWEKEFRSGLSCGVHHHIGIADRSLRMETYNMLRNFVPHMIALSGASPFINEQPSGKIRIRDKANDKQIIARDCVHSYRLLWNTGQMGPNIPQYLPVVPAKGARKADFAKHVRKPAPGDRMVDIYPFTDYDTIELRFFDAQPWIEVHLATAALIQAIALKTRSMLKNKEKIPTVASKILFDNRSKAMNFGLLATFTTDPSLPDEFAKYYNNDVTTGRRASKLLHSVISMLVYLRNELTQLCSDQALDPLLVPVFGTRDLEPYNLVPPASIAEFLLYLYENNGNPSIDNVKPYLLEGSSKPFPLTCSSTLSSIELNAQLIQECSTSAAAPAATKKLKSLSLSLQKDSKKRTRMEVEKRKKVEVTKAKAPVVAKKKKVKAKKPVKKLTKPEIAVKDKKKVKPRKKPPVKKAKKPVQVAKEEPSAAEPAKPAVTTKKKDIEIITSATSQEIEVYSPAIPVDPRYKVIDSKIARVMRERRIQAERKHREMLVKRLEEEKIPFTPRVKKVTYSFPKKIAGKGLFGYIIVEWPSRAYYKLTKNPVTIYTTLSTIESKKKTQLTFEIDTVAASKGVSFIPVYINFFGLEKSVNLHLEARTATNEVLFTHEFNVARIPRKTGLFVDEKDFYVTGRYGQVETVFKGKIVADKKELKGKMRLYLASQSITRGKELLFETKIKAKDQEAVEVAKTVELDPILHRSQFWLVSEITIGKDISFEAIKIDPLREIIVDWDFISREGSPDLKEGFVPKTRYSLDFLFHFSKFLPPPITIEVFVTSFPDGRTKKLASTKVVKEINAGDDYVIEKVEIKTPKNMGYMYFSVDITLQRGDLPMEFISEPAGITMKSND
ncbi:MAG: glutamate-cysteine ligase family protein [Candidatus Hodarchaeales archaeon]